MPASLMHVQGHATGKGPAEYVFKAGLKNSNPVGVEGLAFFRPFKCFWPNGVLCQGSDTLRVCVITDTIV